MDAYSPQGASFGGIAWPILLNQLSRRTSFANAIRATAILAAILLLLSNLLMKTEKRPRLAPQRPKLRAIFCDSAYLVSVAS
jgi:di/tricarboxylate transporter